jgi:hypothetical protein
MENEKMPPQTIEIGVYWYKDDDGKIVFDTEEMQRELEQKIKDISSKEILNELKVNKKELVDNLHNVSEWIVEMISSNDVEEEHIKLMLDKIDETIEYLNN